jgi:hypothetical protein
MENVSIKLQKKQQGTEEEIWSSNNSGNTSNVFESSSFKTCTSKTIQEPKAERERGSDVKMDI